MSAQLKISNLMLQLCATIIFISSRVYLNLIPKLKVMPTLILANHIRTHLQWDVTCHLCGKHATSTCVPHGTPTLTKMISFLEDTYMVSMWAMPCHLMHRAHGVLPLCVCKVFSLYAILDQFQILVGSIGCITLDWLSPHEIPISLHNTIMYMAMGNDLTTRLHHRTIVDSTHSLLATHLCKSI